MTSLANHKVHQRLAVAERSGVAIRSVAPASSGRRASKISSLLSIVSYVSGLADVRRFGGGIWHLHESYQIMFSAQDSRSAFSTPAPSSRVTRSARLLCHADASGAYRSKAAKDIKVLVVGPTGYIGKFVVKVGGWSGVGDDPVVAWRCGCGSCSDIAGHEGVLGKQWSVEAKHDTKQTHVGYRGHLEISGPPLLWMHVSEV